MSDQPLTWTHAGKYVPWLRGQNLHIVDPSGEGTLRGALAPAGFSFAVVDGAGITSKEHLVAALKAALRFPDWCGLGFDALSDCLGDLGVYWKPTDRLALFWRDADVLLEADLLDWVTAVEILQDRARWLWPADHLWTDEHPPRMVLEVFCLVDGGRYGVVTPPDAQLRNEE